MKKKTIKNWEFPQEKGGRNKHSKIWGGGKNKHFWTEYSPLHSLVEFTGRTDIFLATNIYIYI